MGTIRRRQRTQQSGRITPEVRSAFEALDRSRLHAELRLPPWQVSPLDVSGPCPWPKATAGASTWLDSVALLEALYGQR